MTQHDSGDGRTIGGQIGRNACMRLISQKASVAPLLCLLLALGCSEDAVHENADSKTASSAVPTASATVEPVRPAEAKELETLGAALEYDSKSGSVTSVDCSKFELSDELAAKLQSLRQLKKLTIRDSSMSEAGWQSLGQLSEMEQLDVRDTNLSNTQLAAAVSSMPKLRAVRLSGKSGNTEVDDIGLEALASCQELKVLAADHLWVSADGLQHLSGCAQLSELYLAGTLMDDRAMELVAKLPNLKKLRLAKTSVGTVGLAVLSELSLEDLDISECSQVFDDSLAPVGKMKSLKRLNLWRDVISDTGVAHLVGLTNMAWLNLDNTHMGNAGLEHLSGMKQLSFLHLGSTRVTNEGIPLLTPLSSLKELKVTRTAVTEEGLKPLLDANPQVDVQIKYVEGE